MHAALSEEIVRVISFPVFNSNAPFSFRCNANKQAVTPATLQRDHNIKSFDNLKQVIVDADGKNIEQVIYLAEWWTQYDIPVLITFPIFLSKPDVGTMEDRSCFGLDADECYEAIEGKWRATYLLRNEIRELFREDRLVRVEMGDTFSILN